MRNMESQLEFWRSQLQYPDWYIRLEDYLNTAIFPIVHDDPKIKAERHKFYELVEEMLESGEIPLAKTGPDLDAERQSINTIIIHHTEEEYDIRLSKLSAIGFIRQYCKSYLEDDVWGNRGLKGKPIWSGHFREGRMVFFAYHWLVRPDGKADRLLEDDKVGRQSSNLNPSSIGLAFSGNYEHSTPPEEQIVSSARIIKDHYSFVNKANIVGHLEVMEDRTCPGDKFLSGWKNTLLKYSAS